jgi:phosphatidylglycerophosphatase A
MHQFKGYELKYQKGVRASIDAFLFFVTFIMIFVFFRNYWFILIGIILGLIFGCIAKYWFEETAIEKAEYEKLQRENEQIGKTSR